MFLRFLALTICSLYGGVWPLTLVLGVGAVCVADREIKVVKSTAAETAEDASAEVSLAAARETAAE